MKVSQLRFLELLQSYHQRLKDTIQCLKLKYSHLHCLNSQYPPLYLKNQRGSINIWLKLTNSLDKPLKRDVRTPKNTKSSKSLITKNKQTLILIGSLFNARRRMFADSGLMSEELQEGKMKMNKTNLKELIFGNSTSLASSYLQFTASNFLRLNVN